MFSRNLIDMSYGVMLTQMWTEGGRATRGLILSLEPEQRNVFGGMASVTLALAPEWNFLIWWSRNVKATLNHVVPTCKLDATKVTEDRDRTIHHPLSFLFLSFQTLSRRDSAGGEQELPREGAAGRTLVRPPRGKHQGAHQGWTSEWMNHLFWWFESWFPFPVN